MASHTNGAMPVERCHPDEVVRTCWVLSCNRIVFRRVCKVHL